MRIVDNSGGESKYLLGLLLNGGFIIGLYCFGEFYIKFVMVVYFYGCYIDYFGIIERFWWFV